MNRISQQTWEKIHRLGGRSLWSRILADTDEQVELLRDIGFSGEAAAIPEIAWLLVDASGPVWRAAVEAVHRLLDTVAPLDLAALDQHIRDVGSYDREVDRRWRKLRPANLSRFASSEFAVSLLGLASFHGNGYVREAAVEHLAAQTSGHELPFLLIRSNDWVVPVRETAAKAINARIRPEYAPHFLRNLRVVLRLESCGRANRALVDIVCGLLRRAECKEVLRSGMKSSDRALRRASFQLAADAEQSARTAIIRAAVADTDSVARAWAVRRFLPEVTADELPAVAVPLLADRFMPVRRDALWALATKCRELAGEPLKRALLDSHAGMREVARHFLNAESGFDVREFYVNVVVRRESKTLAAAIRGLGESGKSEDVRLVLPFLSASEPRFRSAAAYAIGKLDAEHFLPQLTHALADAMPSVSHEARKALLVKARQQSLDEYWKLFANDKRAFVRRNALVLMLRLGKWEKLAPLLLACADEDKQLAGLAQHLLRGWLRNYNSSFAEPTRADSEKIQDALTRAEISLSHAATAEIRACLKSYFK